MREESILRPCAGSIAIDPASSCGCGTPSKPQNEAGRNSTATDVDSLPPYVWLMKLSIYRGSAGPTPPSRYIEYKAANGRGNWQPSNLTLERLLLHHLKRLSDKLRQIAFIVTYGHCSSIALSKIGRRSSKKVGGTRPRRFNVSKHVWLKGKLQPYKPNLNKSICFAVILRYE